MSYKFGDNQNKRMSTHGKYNPENDRWELNMSFSFWEWVPQLNWPDECYAGNWMIDSDGQFQVKIKDNYYMDGESFYTIPSVPKSWERIYHS